MLFTDVLLAFTLWVSWTFERKETCSFVNLWTCSAGSCCWNGECNTQYGREATSRDPTGKFWKQLVACPLQAAETNTTHQKMHRKKDFPRPYENFIWNLNSESDRKSLLIAGLERNTGGEKLSCKGTIGNSYTDAQLFYAPHLILLFLTFLVGNETVLGTWRCVIFREKVYLKTDRRGILSCPQWLKST